MSGSPSKKKGSATGKTKKVPPLPLLSRGPAGAHEARIKAELAVSAVVIVVGGPPIVFAVMLCFLPGCLVLGGAQVKEDRCREHFENTCHLYKKSRNPCNGELTSREDADFLIPIEHTVKKLSQQAAYSEYERTRTLALQSSGSVDYHSRAIKPNELNRLETLKNKRQLIDNELKQL